MNAKWIGSAVLCTGLAFACGGGEGGGGGSGVPSSTLLVDLTPDQAADFCDYFIGLQESPPRVIDCDGESVEVGIDPADIAGAISECTSGIQAEVMPGCTATVGQAEECFEFLNNLSDAQLCDVESVTPPAACNELISNNLCG